jgi:hypothetical protein
MTSANNLSVCATRQTLLLIKPNLHVLEHKWRIKMNKILKLALAGVLSLVVAIPTVQAATVSGNFNVTVSLTSVCTVASIGPTLAFGTYTAFQPAALIATPTAASLTCTRGLTGVTAAFDTSVGIGSTGAGPSTNAVGAGVIAGLNYNILATPGTPTAGAAATAGGIGTADTVPYVISGDMPLGQAGTAIAGLQTQVRTLTITY